MFCLTQFIFKKSKLNQNIVHCFLFSNLHPQNCKLNRTEYFGTISFFLPFVAIFVFIEMFFVINELSIDLVQTVPNYSILFQSLNDKRCDNTYQLQPFFEPERIFLFCKELYSVGLEALLSIALPDTHPKTE